MTSFKYISSETNTTFNDMVFSTAGRTDLVFSVLACKEARVALSQIPGVLTHYTYELVIGTQENSLTVLKNGIDGPTLTQVTTPGILDCAVNRNFWITWKDGTLSFGNGTVPEGNRILYHRDSNMYPINAVSVMTPLGVKGNFTFGRSAGY